MAGAEWGIEMTPARFDDAIRAIGRIPAVRTTIYERVISDAKTASGPHIGQPH
jgi:2-iminoacetate synthase ThiH